MRGYKSDIVAVIPADLSRRAYNILTSDVTEPPGMSCIRPRSLTFKRLGLVDAQSVEG